MPPKQPASPEQIEVAVEAIRTFWQNGRDSWKRMVARMPAEPSATHQTGKQKKRKKDAGPEYAHGSKLQLLHDEAERIGVNYDTLKKAWNVSLEYTEEQIDELCDLVRKHQARFGATHLSRLLGIKDRKKRDKMTRSAIRERWGFTRLERAIQVANGRRREHVGRRPLISEDPGELLTTLLALCEKWERFCAGAKPKLSSKLKGAVKKATEAVQHVRATADAELASQTGTKLKNRSPAAT